MIIKFLRPGFFLLALACFVLRFMKISCNNTEMVHAKGYNMAFGHTKEKQDTTKSSIVLSDKSNKTADNSDIKMQPLILSAFIALALGLLISLSGFRYSRYIAFVLAFAAVGLFLYYYLDYKNQLDIKEDPKDPMAGKIKIDVYFLYGFWLSLAFSVCAAVSALIPFRNSKPEENIPFPNDDSPEPDDIIHDLAIENG